MKKNMIEQVCDENSTTQIVTRLKLWQNLKTQNVMKLKNLVCDKTQKLKLLQETMPTM